MHFDREAEADEDVDLIADLEKALEAWFLSVKSEKLLNLWCVFCLYFCWKLSDFC